MSKHKILLTGATGYVGGKLLRRLEADGHEINCLVRDPGKLQRPGPDTHVFQGDVLVRSSMWDAFRNTDTAYFLVHFLHDREDFQAKEYEAAENFASMARRAGVKRIIYLGGLGNEQDGLSPHLRSRQDVGQILRTSCVRTLELRASIVLGEGSLSFELIKDLTEHLPFMVTPRWVSTQAQPIGIRDLLDYLVQSLDVHLDQDEIFEIGGADRMSYGDLMREYARQRGLKRTMLPVPALTPWLSSHWVAFFSRVDHHLAAKLIEGIRNPTVIEDDRAKQFFDIHPVSAKEAIREAVDDLPPPDTHHHFARLHHITH
ncbi:NAD(P)H-binding protein [Pontiella sp.]|uniref:NAD(P)H-binding protein n=1 Tax=Pontiella sp. TaxID=2837462 RepID=UPI00356B5EE1